MLLKKILVVIGVIFMPYLAMAMTQEEISQKVDAATRVLGWERYVARGVKGIKEPKEQHVMTLYLNPQITDSPDVFTLRSEADFGEDRILVVLAGEKAFFYQLGGDVAFDVTADAQKIIPFSSEIGYIYGPFRYSRQSSIVEYQISDVDRDGIPCYKVTMTLTPGEKTKAQLLAKFTEEEANLRLSKQPGAAHIIIDKETNFPYSWHIFNNAGESMIFIDFGVVEIVSGWDEELFQLPKGITIETAPPPKALTRRIVSDHYKREDASTSSRISAVSILKTTLLVGIAALAAILVSYRINKKRKAK